MDGATGQVVLHARGKTRAALSALLPHAGIVHILCKGVGEQKVRSDNVLLFLLLGQFGETVQLQW